MKKGFTIMFAIGLFLLSWAAFKETIPGAIAATLLYIVSFFGEVVADEAPPS